MHLQICRAARRVDEALRDGDPDLEPPALHDLVACAERVDHPTKGHVRRVAELAAGLAAAAGLDPVRVRELRLAALLHDLGKAGLPPALLAVARRLTTDEMRLVELHTVLGGTFLARCRARVLRTAGEVATGHHERWDGTGYPRRLAGEAIPASARIVAIADVYDALVSPRPYRDAWPRARALTYVALHAGTQFDPDLARAFVALHDGENRA